MIGFGLNPHFHGLYYQPWSAPLRSDDPGWLVPMRLSQKESASRSGPERFDRKSAFDGAQGIHLNSGRGLRSLVRVRSSCAHGRCP
jgi:hypothetical protein